MLVTGLFIFLLLHMWADVTLFFFNAVTRIEAHNEQMHMQLDIATEIYPMRVGDKINMVLAPTLNLDGTPDTGYYTQVIQRT